MDIFPILEASRMTQQSGEPGAGTVVCLTGPSGVGKTHRVYQYGERIGYKVETIILSRMPSVDVGGIYAPNFETNTLVHMITDRFTGEKLTDEHKGLIVFFDELGSASEEQMVAIQSLIEDRSLEGRPVAKHVMFVAATNLPEHTAGANKIIQSLASRLDFVHIAPDASEWLTRAANDWEIEKHIINFIKQKPSYLHDVSSKSKDLAVPDNRRWNKLDRMFKALMAIFKVDSLPDLIKDHRDYTYIVMSGHIGEKITKEFLTYCGHQHELSSIEEILADPFKAKISQNVSTQHWVVESLGDHFKALPKSKGMEGKSATQIKKEAKPQVEAALNYLVRMGESMCAYGIQELRDNSALFADHYKSIMEADKDKFASFLNL